MSLVALRGRMPLVAFILLAILCLALFGFACGLVPLTAEEAASLGDGTGAMMPASLVEKALRCLEAPIETLIA